MPHALFTLAMTAALLLSPALRICVDASGTEAIELGETDCCDGTGSLPKDVSLGEPDCIDEEISPLGLIRHFDSKDLAGAAVLVASTIRFEPAARECPWLYADREPQAQLDRLTVSLRC